MASRHSPLRYSNTEREAVAPSATAAATPRGNGVAPGLDVAA